MPDKKTCFIIMPVSTPKKFLGQYGDNPNHFIDVLYELFVPAVKYCAFEPILPIMEGTDIIHKEIIENLSNADLVLCDTSIFNPNVLFELGIRTSLNKAVCLVQDDVSDKLPFDTGILNHLFYDSRLLSKTVKEDLPKIENHITKSFEKCKGTNPMWKAFGLKTFADPPIETDDTSFKLDMLLNEFSTIKSLISDKQTPQIIRNLSYDKVLWEHGLADILDSNGITDYSVNIGFSVNGDKVALIEFPVEQRLKVNTVQLEDYAKIRKIILQIRYKLPN